MPSPDLDKYRDRYLQAIKTIMAEQGIETMAEFTDQLNLSYQSLSAIQNKRQFPTVEHGIYLCCNFDLSANWLFLGKGKMNIEEQATLNKILSHLKKL